MKEIILNFSKFFKPWFYVDSRSLGLFRIFFGILCFTDIIRRWDYINIFYTNNSIISASSNNSYYKMFTLLTSFTKTWEVELFFIIGLIFSFFLIIGYKTKLSHVICAIVIISIHNRAIMLENACDMFMNSILIWTLFLPLGISYSIDSLKNSLNYFRENSVSELNNREYGISKPKKVFSVAYFAMLYQISAIYFFTALNKTGYDWENGSAVYKMLQLDTFLTPVGYFVRDYVTPPISKFLTYSTHNLEFIVVILIFLPFFNHISRFFLIICLTIFHVTIRLFVKVGLFSQTMIVTYLLLIDTKIYDAINKVIVKYFLNNKKYILFYDSDCGFCHYAVRIIKRLDLYSKITFADASYKGEKPNDFEKLSIETAILFEKDSKQLWTKHQAFGKTLMLIPFGFLIGWIFFIPILSLLFEKIYDLIAFRRTSISQLFGQPACGLDSNQITIQGNRDIKQVPFQIKFRKLGKVFSSFVVIILIISTFHYNLVANESVNKHIVDLGYEKKFRHKKFFKRIVYYPRMVQRWNMFSPTVLKTDKTIVVKATLYDGSVIDIFTGKEPVLDSVDYKDIWKDHDQFWRKFFTRLSKKNNKKYINTFERWIKKSTNNYFEENLNGQKIKSVEIWYVHHSNTDMNTKREHKVYKRLLNGANKK